MVEQPFGVVESKKKGADFALLARVPKAANDTVGGSDALHFYHRALTAQVQTVELLGNHAVSLSSRCLEPFFGLPAIQRHRRNIQTIRDAGSRDQQLKSFAA